MSDYKKRKKRSFTKRFRRTAHGAKNAVKLIRGSRFTAPYEAPYEVVVREKFLRLRRYTALEGDSTSYNHIPILMVPPLMVTSQVYDIAPALSAVKLLKNAGFDVWLTDFGVPEKELGGMERTLDDHLLLIDSAIDFVREQSGSDVHMAGYSQGGMFIYQVTAYRKSRGVASITTFGSPVDLNKNVPGGMHRDLVDRLLNSARAALSWTLDDLKGVPGSFTSMGFKLVSPRQELRYLKMMLGILGDREALSKIEPTRRFLGGEGFIAWPGPAFRSFVDNIIVQNRMMTGGFVVNGRPVTLSDITIPILYFVGEKDDFARPPSVRAIQRVVSSTEVYEVSIHAGHFGLVVGSRSLREVWPTVSDWMKWLADEGPKPESIVNTRQEKTESLSEKSSSEGSDFSGFVSEMAEDVWEKMGDVSLDVSGALSFLRWQSPRLGKLVRLGMGARVNMGQRLEDQAREIPDHTFFLYDDRAYTYEDANIRVNQFVYSLLTVGVAKGDYVGIMMDNHPDYLTLIVALNRMGAVAVLINPGAQGTVLEQAITEGRVNGVIADPAHLGAVCEVLPNDRTWMVWGNTPGVEVPKGVACLEKLMDERIRDCPLKSGANPGHADDIALLVFTSGTTGLPKAARISNGRWMMAATGAAVAGGLTPNDTVYCCLPLYHATGLLLGAGGAMVGGSRLVLSPKFSVSGFWHDVRHCGATVIFYVGELCRYLITAPDSPSEKNHSVRLFFGNGMRADVWEELVQRFGKVRVLEFYASTEGNTVLANLSGEKVGSVGRPPVLSPPLELVKYDVENGKFIRDAEGNLVSCEDDEPGMLLGKISSLNPFSKFEGYTSREASKEKVLTGAFERGDRWFITGDILRRDEDGDYWFVDRVGDTFRWKGENISTEQVATVVSRIPWISLCAVYGIQLDGREGRAGMAAVKLAEGVKFDGDSAFKLIQSELMPAGRPRFIRVVKELQMTSSLKVIKHRLQQEGIDRAQFKDSLYWYNDEKMTYTKLTKRNHDKAMSLL